MTDLLLKQAALDKAFQKIGTTNGTGPLESRDNRSSIAYELYVADKLASLADARKKKAKEAAQEAGILGDKSTFVPGTAVQVYDNEYLEIVAKTSNPASRIDKTALENELVKALGRNKATDLLSKVTKENAAATSYQFVAR